MMYAVSRRLCTAEKAVLLTRCCRLSTMTSYSRNFSCVQPSPTHKHQTHLHMMTSSLLMSRSMTSYNGGEGGDDVKMTSYNEDMTSSMTDNDEVVLEIGVQNIDDITTTTTTTTTTTASDVSSTFADYGLGGHTWPSQWLHNLMEVLHCDMGIPWIPTIMTTCVILRTLAIPFYAKMQAFNARSHNTMPQQMKLQAELNMCTSTFEKQKKGKELMEFMSKHGTNPITQLPYILPTAFIFTSFFAAARKMAEVKLPSLMEGGALWFTDLTISDPYYILPVLTGVSLHLLVRFGGAMAEGGPMADQPMFRNLFLYGPFVMVPFIAWQPSLLFIFWITSNTYSFFLMKAFQQQGVRNYFNIAEKRAYSPSQQLHMMKQQQDAMMSAMKKVKNHNQQMKKFSDDHHSRKNRRS